MKQNRTTFPWRSFLVIAVVAALCQAMVLWAGQRPEYHVFRTNVPVQVDGALDDAVWAKAPLVGQFVNSIDGSPTPLETEARALYDDEFLYLAFRCLDDNIWSTYRKRDEHLWTEEVVEVFIHANREKPSYIEIEVNPLGTMLDIYLLDVRKPIPYESWNSARLQWAVKVDGSADGQPGDHQWTCEIALPVEDVVTAPSLPPRPGDRWRVNLYRVESLPKKAGLAWAPTHLPDFHLPNMFGDFVFSEETVP